MGRDKVLATPDLARRIRPLNGSQFVAVETVAELGSAFCFPAFPCAVFVFISIGLAIACCDSSFVKLHRASVVQLRVQSRSVIPEQPVEDSILGLAKGFKVSAVQPFHLQKANTISEYALTLLCQKP
jgi:hypothetical protein